MSKVLIEEASLIDIGDAIRSKNNGNTQYKPSEMGAAIRAISEGITPTGTVNITQNGTVNVTQYASAAVNVPNSYAESDEGKVVFNGGLVSQTSRTSQITENGTYDTTLNNEITVNIPSNNINNTLNWKDTFSVNWDFANAINTRGANQYSTSGLIYTIDGWQLQGGILTISNGGVKLSRYSSGTAGYFMQRYKVDPTAAFVGKTLTLSIIIDGVLYSGSGTISTGAGSKIYFSADNEIIRVYYYSTQGEIAATIDISTTISNKLIEAIKLESGTSQSLATQINGVWVLNNSMDSDTEYIKARCGLIYNS